MDMVTYQQATGFESLIGYLSLIDEQRAKDLINLGITFIKQGGYNG
jgi:ribonuclease-3 family protein